MQIPLGHLQRSRGHPPGELTDVVKRLKRVEGQIGGIVRTRADGIVPWSACRYEVRSRRENVEVRGSHLGLAGNPAVLWLLADRLGMAEGAWTPFRPLLGLGLLFPRRR